MAYRADLNPRAKSAVIAAVIALHAALLAALLTMSGKADLANPQSVLKIFDVINPPPPPPNAPKPRALPKQKEGGSAPKNIKSKATPVVAPKPQIATPPVQHIVATPTPATGAAPTQGASNVRGPGTGAGGSGNGTGSGFGGAGAGAGGGVAVSASLLRGITGRDYPEEIQRGWPRGGVIYIRLRVEPNGRPSRCDVMKSFGDAMADRWTCALLMQRSEFRPALDARGTPVASWFGYKQVDIGD